MQEVVCFNCGRIVHISPDAELCSVCGENLRELIHPAYISKYFYDRAAEMAAGTELLQALREIDRGLTYYDSSELRLLGAILSQRIGDFEQMRQHVAAIPVDDVLRTEAEWLLRSHQTRLRAQRSGTNGKSVSLAELDPLPALPAKVQRDLVSRQAPEATHQRHATGANRMLMYGGLFVLAIAMTGIALGASGLLPTYLPWLNATPAMIDQMTDLPAPVHQSDIDTVTTGLSDRDDGAGILQPTATSLPPIDLQVPEDVVEGEGVGPLAESTSVLLVPLQPFELTAYLEEVNRPDLGALSVVASSQDGIVLLQGIVPSFRDRQDLLALMEEAPGVQRVSGADLLIRLPPTYIVQEGDTLWAISANLYGENKIEQLLEANQGVLVSANSLRVGMTLTIPALD